MSASGKLGCYAGLGLVFLWLVCSAEPTLQADFGLTIPDFIKTPMNTAGFLLLAILAVLIALHFRGDDDGD